MKRSFHLERRLDAKHVADIIIIIIIIIAPSFCQKPRVKFAARREFWNLRVVFHDHARRRSISLFFSYRTSRRRLSVFVVVFADRFAEFQHVSIHRHRLVPNVDVDDGGIWDAVVARHDPSQNERRRAARSHRVGRELGGDDRHVRPVLARRPFERRLFSLEGF